MPSRRVGESYPDYIKRKREYERNRENNPIRKAWKEKYEKERRARPERKAARKVWDDRFRNKDSTRSYLLRWTYGITIETYNHMLTGQNGVCAICGGVNANGRKLSVDHNHQTDAVRGLLCMQCNMLLGNAKDNVSILLKSIEYLNKWNQQK